MNYQYTAGLQSSTGEIIYSRALHDTRYTSDKKEYVDGGLEYFRASSGLTPITIELNVDPATLFNDWNCFGNKYGLLNTSSMFLAQEFIRIVHSSDVEDKNTLEYKQKYATWGTYGKEGKGPYKRIMLENAETSHLESILATQLHIKNSEIEKIIVAILAKRVKLKE